MCRARLCSRKTHFHLYCSAVLYDSVINKLKLFGFKHGDMKWQQYQKILLFLLVKNFDIETMNGQGKPQCIQRCTLAWFHNEMHRLYGGELYKLILSTYISLSTSRIFRLRVRSDASSVGHRKHGQLKTPSPLSAENVHSKYLPRENPLHISSSVLVPGWNNTLTWIDQNVIWFRALYLPPKRFYFGEHKEWAAYNFFTALMLGSSLSHEHVHRTIQRKQALRHEGSLTRYSTLH